VSARENAALVLRLYEAFDKGALEAFGGSIGSNFVAHVLGTTFRAAFADGRHVFDHIVADGENIVTIGTYRGTHTGEMHGIAPTNRQLRLTVMHLDRVVNGKIVEHRGLANEVDFMRQLGIELVPK
jgi:predicted ester cyclase